VASAPKLDVADRGVPTVGVWHNVVEFEKAAFRAPTLTADERAPAIVALPYRPLDRSRDVSATWRADARGTRRLRVRRQLRLPNGIKQECQRPVEDSCRITIRDRVAEQVLGARSLS
jgi:hypothetical protein